MGFNATAVKAIHDAFKHLGENAVFTPSAGTPKACTVILKKETAIEPGGYDAQVVVPVVTLEYIVSEVGREVERYETFTVGSGVWTVEGPYEDENANDFFTHKVVVRK